MKINTDLAGIHNIPLLHDKRMNVVVSENGRAYALSGTIMLSVDSESDGRESICPLALSEEMQVAKIRGESTVDLCGTAIGKDDFDRLSKETMDAFSAQSGPTVSVFFDLGLLNRLVVAMGPGVKGKIKIEVGPANTDAIIVTPREPCLGNPIGLLKQMKDPSLK